MIRGLMEFAAIPAAIFTAIGVTHFARAHGLPADFGPPLWVVCAVLISWGGIALLERL